MTRTSVALFCCVLFSITAASPVQKKPEPPSDTYANWLKQDVVYLITPEEEAVFKKLETPEEKESFIEQFWSRRDTDPITSNNEFKEEHYRRIAYANDNYAYAGIPGWKTDRGRTYIVFGPPTNRERYGAGAMYQRPMYEGGGATATYPFEKWYYNHIEGIGDGIELEFVDPTMTGGYRLALRPEEKDALLHMPGGGLTYYEMAGLETRQGRIKTMDAMHDLGTEGEGSYRRLSNPFRRTEVYFQVQRPPEIRFKDLKAKVEARVTFSQMPLFVTNSYVILNDKAFLVPITVVVSKESLTYVQQAGGAARATVHIYGSIQDLSGKIVREFEDTVYGEGGDATLQGIYFQKQLPVAPGLYRLTIIVRDAESGKLGLVERRLDIPKQVPSTLDLSALVLADYIVPAQGGSLPDPFVTAMGWKIYPSMQSQFETGRSLGLYFEAYGYGVDASSFAPDLEAAAKIRNSAGEVVQDAPHQNHTVLLTDRAVLAMVFNLEGVAPGKYSLEIELQDKIAQKKVVRKAPFSVVAATQSASARTQQP